MLERAPKERTHGLRRESRCFRQPILRRLSKSRFWRSQIGLAFIFFSLLPSLTEAQWQCEVIDYDWLLRAASEAKQAGFNDDPKPPVSDDWKKTFHSSWFFEAASEAKQDRGSVEDFFKRNRGLLSDPAEDQNFYSTQLWAFQKAAAWLKAEPTWRGSSLDEQWEELKKILDPFFYPDIIEAVRKKFFAASASGNPLSPEEFKEILKKQSSYDEIRKIISELILQGYLFDDDGNLILDPGEKFPRQAGAVNLGELYRLIGGQTAIAQTPGLDEAGMPVFSSDRPLPEARPHLVPPDAVVQFFYAIQSQVAAHAIRSWLGQNSRVKEVVSRMINDFRLWEGAKAPNQQLISDADLARYLNDIDAVFQSDGPEIENQEERKKFIKIHLESVQNIIFHTRRSLLNLEIELAKLAQEVPEPREDILGWASKEDWKVNFRIKDGKLESQDPGGPRPRHQWRQDFPVELKYLAEMKALQSRRQSERDQQILELEQIREALIGQAKSLMNDADQRELNADQDLAREFTKWSWESPDVVGVGLRLKWEDVKQSFLSRRNTLATQIPPHLEEVFKANYYRIALQRNVDEYRSLIHAKQIERQAGVWSDPEIHTLHQAEFDRGSLLASFGPDFKLRIKALIQNAPWPKEYKEAAEKDLRKLDAAERAANSGGVWTAVSDALDVVSETLSSGYASWVKNWHGLSDQQYDLIKDDGLILAGRILYDFGIMTLATAATMGTFGSAANARVLWNGWKILKLKNGGVVGWRAAAPLARLVGVNAAMSGSAAIFGELYAAYQDDAPTLGPGQRIANVLLNTNQGMRDSGIFMAAIAGTGRGVGVVTNSPRTAWWTTFLLDLAEALPNMPEALQRISDAGGQADSRALWGAVGLLAVEAFDSGGDVILSGVARQVRATVQDDLISRRIKQNFSDMNEPQRQVLLDEVKKLRDNPNDTAALRNYLKNAEKSVKEMIDALKAKNIELNSDKGGAYLGLALTMTNSEFSVSDLMAFIDRNTSQFFTAVDMAALVKKAEEANNSIEGPPLNSSQLRAIVEAHLVGQGINLNQLKNSDLNQLKSKLIDQFDALALKLNPNQIQVLIKAGVVGLSTAQFAQIAKLFISDQLTFDQIKFRRALERLMDNAKNNLKSQLQTQLQEVLDSDFGADKAQLQKDLQGSDSKAEELARNIIGAVDVDPTNTNRTLGASGIDRKSAVYDNGWSLLQKLVAYFRLRSNSEGLGILAPRFPEAIEALEEIAKGSDAAKAKAAIDALASTNTSEAIDALLTIA